LKGRKVVEVSLIGYKVYLAVSDGVEQISVKVEAELGRQQKCEVLVTHRSALLAYIKVAQF
jgi:hypothetical protein